MIDSADDTFLCRPSSVRQAVLQIMGSMEGDKATADTESVHWRMEELGQHYVVSAFRRMGWQPEAGQQITTSELMWGLGIKERYRQLIERLLSQIAERIDDQWYLFHTFDSQEKLLFEQLRTEYPQVETEIALFKRCADQLPAVLTGKLDPLSLLFPADEQVSARKLYRDSPVARACNVILAEILKTVTKQEEVDRRFRILEIGAGTGGATSAILPVLPRDRTEYSYTDISAAFFEKAAIQFREYDFISYSVLDIEENPRSQGIDPGNYDLIVSANVLHSTRDLTEVLGHIQQLLAPRGLLVIQETTQQQIWLDFTFGLLPGWWKFHDPVRTSYPLISANQWSKLLRAQGFFDVSVLIPQGIRSQAILVAQEGIK